jgi:hypothetical protein
MPTNNRRVAVDLTGDSDSEMQEASKDSAAKVQQSVKRKASNSEGNHQQSTNPYPAPPLTSASLASLDNRKDDQSRAFLRQEGPIHDRPAKRARCEDGMETDTGGS